MNKSSIAIGLLNPKNPDNVGSVMRAAGNFGVNSVFYTGSRYPRAIKLGSVNTRRKISETIPLTGVTCLLDDIPDGITLVCIEFAENAIPLPEYQHPENAFYIFGPEDGSISQDIINQADAVVYVPTAGCMNLAATVNVVLYDRLVKSYFSVDNTESNKFISINKDVNNNLKVSR